MDFYTLIGSTRDEVHHVISNKDNYYLSFAIKKSNGKTRWISAPQGILKNLQYSILYNILYKFKPHRAATGFIKNKSVKDGALAHLGNKSILSMDIEDFFPSVHYYVVEGMSKILLKRMEQYHPDLVLLKTNSKEMASLLTLQESLPQGSPASPAMANLVFKSIDNQITSIAQSNNCVYTRYADDISISHPDPNYSFYHISDLITYTLRINGFSVNNKKSRVRRPNRRMEVTGVVINEKLGVARSYWRNIRAQIHNIKIGKQQITEHEMQKLRGKIEWVTTLHPTRGAQLLEELGKATSKTCSS